MHQEKNFSLSLNSLKYIAIIAMFIDHFAYSFMGGQAGYDLMRMIGRTTAPIMFFAAVEGYHHTKNLSNYLIRLGIFAAISYFPYMFMINGGRLEGLDPLSFNVIFTIFLGVSAVHARRTIRQSFLKFLTVFVLIACSITSDWGISGVLIILIFDFYYGDLNHQLFGFLTWILLDSGLLNMLSAPFLHFFYNGVFLGFDFLFENIIPFGFFIPLFLLSRYNGELGDERTANFSKWVFYLFYPSHLLLLGYLNHIS